MSVASFISLLAAFSAVMVVAMVQHAKAFLAAPRDEERARAWAWVYALTWISIIALLTIYTDGSVMVFAIPAVILAVHVLILWTAGRRARLAPAAGRRRSAGWQPARSGPAVRATVNLFMALLFLVIGESIPALHRLDAALMPHRPMLRVLLPSLIGAGFAMFMGGILWLVFTGKPGDGAIQLHELRYTWRTTRAKRFFVITGGVLLAMLAGAAMAVVFAPAGVKFLVMLAVAFVIARLALR